MRYARIEDNIVQEIIVPHSGFTIDQMFHPDIVAILVTVPDEVDVGWIKQEDGTYIPPPTPP